MHDNWILHRDIKASNLLLSHKGILKVLIKLCFYFVKKCRVGAQWRHQGVDWGRHVHPSFHRGRFSNFSKSVEKTCLGGWFLFTWNIWLCSFGCLHCTSLFRCLLLQKCPPLQKMMLEKAAFPIFWNRSKMQKRAFLTFSESLKGVVDKYSPLLFVHPSFLGWRCHWVRPNLPI